MVRKPDGTAGCTGLIESFDMVIMQTRRNIIRNGGLITVGAMASRPATLLASSAPLFPNGYPDRNGIISAAVESALAAGASYADARLSHKESLIALKYAPGRTENMAFGVRALYRGYWGFAASSIWSVEEGARLGAAAVEQAKASVLGRERVTDLAPLSNVTNGHWETPVKQDPFKIDPDEILDFNWGLMAFIRSLENMGNIRTMFSFERNNKAFGSSSNQFVTQTLYSASGAIEFDVRDKDTQASILVPVEELSPAGQGYEYFRDRPIRDYIRTVHEEALADLKLPVKPIDVGRYNILVDQSGIANLLSKSVGSATEVDRVFGFEANSGGTSYINEPEVMLGTLKIGSPLMNVLADRSQSGSIGRVRWDDEGVEPTKQNIVKDGILTDLQTNREGASWITDYYKKSGLELKSSGSASAPTALDVPRVHKSDLHLLPAQDNVSRDSLRESLGDGIEFRVPNVSMDFQQVTGMIRGKAYEIKNGKRAARFIDAGVLFRTSEIWNNMYGIGGHDSVRYYGIVSTKGQPPQDVASGVYAPPAIFKEMTLIDVKRKG